MPILERIIDLSPRTDRKDLMRLAACREAVKMWRDLSLKPEELEALGTFLNAKLLDSAPEKSLYWTGFWLEEKKPEKSDHIECSPRTVICDGLCSFTQPGARLGAWLVLGRVTYKKSETRHGRVSHNKKPGKQVGW